jgi:hypothetical protein
MTPLFNAANCLRNIRRRMLFGEFSREPLRLLRLEWKSDSVECDWMMRPPDKWDSDLPAYLVEEHQTLQALRDAMGLRNIVFASFSDVDCAELRMFREDADGQPQLMMTGTVRRCDEVLPRVESVAMQAILCGFHFCLVEGVLKSMNPVSVGCR